MKLILNQPNRRKLSGFTLIEMIGVLAVIAILAAVLIPKVFEAINNARVNNAAMGCNAAKTAVIDHYAKFGGLLLDGRTTTPATPFALGDAAALNFDAVLLGEQFMDKPFSTKIGDANTGAATKTRVTLLAVPATVGAADGGFALAGSGSDTPPSDISGSAVAIAVITGVLAEDARSLNRKIDGESASMGEITSGADLKGRVKYAAPDSTTKKTDVYVYLTHR